MAAAIEKYEEFVQKGFINSYGITAGASVL